MGQRLVVTIEKNQKAIAKLYYHWSAYTGDALYKTRDIIDCIYNHQDETEKEMLLRLIHFCEKSGGGIKGGFENEEWDYITSMYPNEEFKKHDICRSNGIIALSDEGMTDMQRWSEGDVYINLDEDRVDFCVYAGYESLDEYLEIMAEDDDFEGLTLEDIPYIDHDLGYFDVSDINDIIAAFEKTDDVHNLIRFGSEIVELC
jgi:hypothetical protein